MHVLSTLAAESNNTSGGIVQLAIFLLIPIAMYFLLIRPQRRRQREQVEMQKAIEVGDEVICHRLRGRDRVARDRRQRADSDLSRGNPAQG
jgi:preprotein translocase YajC subunit